MIISKYFRHASAEKVTKSLSLSAFLFSFATALLFSSCNENDLVDKPCTPATQEGEISFSIGFAKQDANSGSQTRAFTAADFTGTWEDGDEIGIFAVKSGNPLAASDNYINNVKLTYSGGSWTSAEPLYWPTIAQDIASLDFYAYHPYNAAATNPTAIDFNVKIDQSNSTDGKSNYSLSDLLTAKTEGATKGSTVQLAFSHALAMVQVSLPGGKGWGGGNEGLSVTLRGVKPAAKLNLSNPSGSEVSLAETNNNATSITMYRMAEPANGMYIYRALVPAQTVDKGSRLFFFDYPKDRLFTDGALAAPLSMTAGRAEKFERTLPGAVVETVDILPEATSFTMGEDGWTMPVHTATLKHDFRMGKYPVTNSQYAAFLNATGIGKDGRGTVSYTDKSGNLQTETQPFVYNSSQENCLPWGVTHENGQWASQIGYENHPVIYVTWYGAKAYADWAGASLPTDEQWEYAVRGGTTTPYYYGPDRTNYDDYVWCSENSSDGTKPVGQKLPNNYGLYDMLGNVWEWSIDLYDIYESSKDNNADAQQKSSNQRAVRGGGWYYDSETCRSSSRASMNPETKSPFIGFRVVFNP